MPINPHEIATARSRVQQQSVAQHLKALSGNCQHKNLPRTYLKRFATIDAFEAIFASLTRLRHRLPQNF
jgi:hypothetical protein